MIDFNRESEMVFDEVVTLRRDFHKYPEPSQKEHRTAAVVAGYLENLGIQVDKSCAGELPGVCGVLRGGRPGPAVALRADMDALHIQEENTCEYRSKEEGVMHACGHDCHTAILLGTAKVLAKYKKELAGTVRFLFEPAEEDIGGAKFMVEQGVMDGVDAVFGLHMDPMYPAGHIAVCPGEMTAASDHLFIWIRGKSVHGARPHLGTDAIMMAGHFLTAVQSMIAREKDPFEHAVVTFGQIQGGTARNIVCDEVELKGICRTMNPETRGLLNEHLERILKGITEAFGGSYELKRRQGHPSLRNDPAMTGHVMEWAGRLAGEDKVHVMPRGSLEAESFAYFSEKAPGSFYRLGCGNEAKGITALLHTPRFDVDESCLKLGVAMQCALVMGYGKDKP